MAKGKGQTRGKGKARPKSKRQQRIERAKLKERQKRLRKRGAIIAALLLALGLGSYLLLSQGGSSMIEVTPRVYSFGTVSQAGGVVTAELILENKGGSELVINGMRTSCGCTQASLIIDGEEGPLFGMHNNPVGWRARLGPGEQAPLRVYYDPNVHGALRGTVTREIEIFSNDPKSPVYTVQIELVQTG